MLFDQKFRKYTLRGTLIEDIVFDGNPNLFLFYNSLKLLNKCNSDEILKSTEQYLECKIFAKHSPRSEMNLGVTLRNFVLLIPRPQMFYCIFEKEFSKVVLLILAFFFEKFPQISKKLVKFFQLFQIEKITIIF